MNTTSTLSLSALALAAATGAAHAQTTDAPKPFAARLSIILPTNRSTRTLIGKSSGQVGVSYAPIIKGADKIAPRIDLDYARFAKRGNRIEPVSLLATGIVPITKQGLTRGPYVGVGVGAAYTRLRINPTNAIPVFRRSKTGFASKAFIGYNFTPNIFGEIGYNQVPSVSGFNPSNAFIQIGARF